MGRESDGVICLTFGDFERSDQGQLRKNMVSVQDSARVNIEHWYKVIGRESDGVISLICLIVGELERSDQSDLLKMKFMSVSVAIVAIEN